MRNRILLVDDESGVRFGIRSFLETHGYQVEEAESCAEAEKVFRERRPDAAVLDYRLPDGNALDLLARLKAVDSGVPMIILTAHGSIDLAVKAVKDGAENFVTKPVELPAMLVLVERMIEAQRDRQKNTATQKRQARNMINPFDGGSDAIQALEDECNKVIRSESPIIIHGETGAGKGVLAQWLHAVGPRADEPFVDLNCAGLSKEFLETELFGHEKGAFTGATSRKPGLLEVAHRGTVFLDEIGDMNMEIQPKLLKVLEEKRYRRLGDHRDRTVDIRLIAASHQDLRKLVAEKKFREDLFFRVSTIPLSVPSLRDRDDDVLVIGGAMLKKLAAQLGRGKVDFSDEAKDAMRAYPWPGNIRELRNVLERAVLLSSGTELSAADLRFDSSVADGAPPAASTKLTLREVEERHIQRVLREETGHVGRTAKRLGVPRSTLYQKIKKYGLSTGAKK